MKADHERKEERGEADDRNAKVIICFNLNNDFTGAVLIGRVFSIYHSLSATPPLARIPVKRQPQAEQTRRLCRKVGRAATTLKKKE